MDYIFTFEGRLRRSKYFWGLAILLIATVLVSFLIGFAGEALGMSGRNIMLILIVVVAIATVLQLNLAARRFNDMGWSGWCVLLLLIPLVNVVLLLMLYFMKGSIGPNQYGEDPTVRMMIDDSPTVVIPSKRTVSLEPVKEYRENQNYIDQQHVLPTPSEGFKAPARTASLPQNTYKPQSSQDGLGQSAIIGYTLLGIVVLSIVLALLFSNHKTEEDKIAEMKEAIELFNNDSYDKSFAILSQYAEEDFFTDEAYYCLGYMYGEGLGTVEDDVAANDIMIFLSEWEDSDFSKWANHYLGFQYYNGEGTTVNTDKSYNSFIKAARSGVVNSMLPVAQLYHNGEGTSKDLKKAKYWYEKAAEEGVVEAQEALKGADFRPKRVQKAKEYTPTYYYGQIVKARVDGILWDNLYDDKEVAVITAGEHMEIISTSTGSPDYYYVLSGGKHGYFKITNIQEK